MTKPELGSAIDRLLTTLAIPVELQQREAIGILLQMKHDWQPAEQAGVIAAILARSPRQLERLQIELRQLLEGPAPSDQSQASSPIGAGPVLPPPDEPSPIEKVTRAVSSVHAAIGAIPKRNALTLAAILAVGAGLALVAFSSDFEVPVPLVFKRDWSGTRNILIWILGGLAIALPLGWVIEVAGRALPIFQEKLRRPVLVTSLGDQTGVAWFAPEAVGQHALLRLFNRQQALSMGRAGPFRAGSLDSPAFDPQRSVQATVTSGVPALCFVPAREPWPVLVLDDVESGARGWSEMPRAIRDTLASTGLDVGIAAFYGLPDRFQLEDGTRLDVEGLLRLETLVLFVSDGAALGDAPESIRLLERLALTRRAAWLDERETHFWHPADTQFTVSGLPAWPATAHGVDQALRCLGGERLAPPRPARRAMRGPSSTAPSAILARGLGYALPWAAACAMIQPVSPGLGALLRARFFAHVEPIAFGRMVKLPGSRLTQSGLRFGQDLLDPLRREFATGNESDRCDEILQCIRREVERKEPQRGPAHDAWRWYRARFLMDQSFGEAVNDLVGLRNTPLGGAIAEELSRVRLPDAPMAGEPDGMVRLLRNPAPADVGGLVRLAKAYDVHPAGTAINVWRILPGQPDPITLPRAGVAAAVSANAPAGKFLAVVLDDGAVLSQEGDQVFAPGEALRNIKSSSREERRLFALSHDGRFAADANGDHTGIRVRDLWADGREPLLSQQDRWKQSSQMEGPITALAWSPVAPVLLLASRYEGVGVLDFSEPEPTVAWADLERLYAAVAFSPDGASALFVMSDGQALIRSSSALLEVEKEEKLPVDLDDVEAVALGAAVVASVASGRLAINRRNGEPVGSWQLSYSRVEALELTDSEQAVAVLANGALRVIHAATGIDLLVDDAPELRGRQHAAIGIDRQLAVLWSPDRKGIDLHMMSRNEAAVSTDA